MSAITAATAGAVAALPTLLAHVLPNVVAVARPRTAVQHLADVTDRPLTGTGRLPRGARPWCGRPGAWRTDVASPGRRLCRGCARHAHRTSMTAAAATAVTALPRPVLAQLLADVLGDCQDPQVLNAARLLTISGPVLQNVDGRPLSAHVAAATVRLAPPVPPGRHGRRLVRGRLVA